MGVDIVIISQHNLNIENVQKLAKDLSERLKINVDYGYQDHIKIDFKTGENLCSFEMINLGKVIHPLAKVTYFLNDEIYQRKEYIEQYGSEFLNQEEPKILKHLKNEMKEYLGKQHYELDCSNPEYI